MGRGGGEINTLFAVIFQIPVPETDGLQKNLSS